MTYKTIINRLIQARYSLLLIMVVVAMPVYADNDTNTGLIKSSETVGRGSYIKIVPERCVALREGQMCYQNVMISWQADTKDSYCLYSAQIVRPIHCWNDNKGTYELDFQSSVGTEYILRRKSDQQEIAKADLIVAWVYGNKKRRRASWRLF